jgi:hypothetical protein
MFKHFHILVVGDDKDMQDIVKNHLSAEVLPEEEN